MRRLILLFAALGGIACKSDDPVAPAFCDANTQSTSQIPEPFVNGEITGDLPGLIRGKVAAYHQGSELAQFTVIDGFEVDAQKRPTAELFVFMRSAPGEKRLSLVPVTLAQLHDKNFVPSGSFAVYAKDYDVAAGDYTRWLIGTSGCLRITGVWPGVVGAISASVALDGEWRSNTGTQLGHGALTATVIGSPLINLANATLPFLDFMNATVTGVRAKPFAATTLDSYQVLRAGQERLVIVATQPADTTRELWLSIAGVPASTFNRQGDSIPLEPITLAEARAGRADPTKSFAMMRMLQLNGSTPTVREIWRSTTGWVKFLMVVQNGPLAICGAVSGTFAVTMQGTSLAAPGIDLGVTTITNGSFDSRISVLAPADSLTDPVTVPPAANRFFLAAPASKKGTKCP